MEFRCYFEFGLWRWIWFRIFFYTKIQNICSQFTLWNHLVVFHRSKRWLLKNPIQRNHRCSCRPFHTTDWCLHLYYWDKENAFNFVSSEKKKHTFALQVIQKHILVLPELNLVQLYLSMPVKLKFSANVVRFACLNNGWFCISTMFGRSSGNL